MIWRLLLLRPATINPGYIKYHIYAERRLGRHGEGEHRAYGYQWDECRQIEKYSINSYRRDRGLTVFVPSYNRGRHNGRQQKLKMMVLTNPTFHQAECIARGETSLPFTYESQTGCEVIYRGEAGDQFAQVVNSIELILHPLCDLAILRVNKQALSECRKVLYGENTFAFNTASYAHQNEHYLHCIPRCPEKNGIPQTSRQLNKAIDRMFVSGGFFPNFVSRDPILQFFHRIGRVNASLLTKIKLEGRMKTMKNDVPDERQAYRPLGFSQILNIAVAVLKNVCPDLRELILRMEDKHKNGNFKEAMLWDDDPYNKARKSDVERIDELVERVVVNLDSLKVLKLEGYHFCQHVNDGDDRDKESTTTSEDEWGKSVRWMKFVAERAVTQEAKEANDTKALDENGVSSL